MNLLVLQPCIFFYLIYLLTFDQKKKKNTLESKHFKPPAKNTKQNQEHISQINLANQVEDKAM